jgi:hypothetical protein
MNGRAAEAAALTRQRFPQIEVHARTGDGLVALRSSKADVVIATVDSAAATAAIVAGHDVGRATVFQLVGRGRGTSTTGAHIGVAGLVRSTEEHRDAALLLAGLDALTNGGRTSSRILTESGDPLTARVLKPLREATSRQTARFIDRLRRSPDGADEPALTFFTAGRQSPLIVLEDRIETFAVRQARSIAAVETIGLQRLTTLAAVAFVNIHERVIDVVFVARTRTDTRWVEGVETFRTSTSLLPSAKDFDFTD